MKSSKYFGDPKKRWVIQGWVIQGVSEIQVSKRCLKFNNFAEVEVINSTFNDKVNDQTLLNTKKLQFCCKLAQDFVINDTISGSKNHKYC